LLGERRPGEKAGGEAGNGGGQQRTMKTRRTHDTPRFCCDGVQARAGKTTFITVSQCADRLDRPRPLEPVMARLFDGRVTQIIRIDDRYGGWGRRTLKQRIWMDSAKRRIGAHR
jgi:hypothetical protein